MILLVPVHQHGKGGGLDTPHIQGAVVEDGEQPGSVDPDEPVRFLAAEGGLIQRVILRAGAQVLEALPDRRVLHGGDPQAGEGLLASRHLIGQPEDELASRPASQALTSSVTSSRSIRRFRFWKASSLSFAGT